MQRKYCASDHEKNLLSYSSSSSFLLSLYVRSEAISFSLFSGKRQINREGEKENCAEDLRNNLRRGELYGFDNRAIAFGGHVNFFEGAGIISSEADKYN